MVYLVIRFFGVIVHAAGTPYTLQECEDSLSTLELPEELQAAAECVYAASRPEHAELSPDQQRQVDAWAARQRPASPAEEEA